MFIKANFFKFKFNETKCSRMMKGTMEEKNTTNTHTTHTMKRRSRFDFILSNDKSSLS